ncbi:hypothetical protein GGR57DRAFT_469746 [Xylariaceae sp. FL1272]|nr:hypothetical protein GGR57DRAFT_469746 [Xylariaceae sp. FL1272]
MLSRCCLAIVRTAQSLFSALTLLSLECPVSSLSSICAKRGFYACQMDFQIEYFKIKSTYKCQRSQEYRTTPNEAKAVMDQGVRRSKILVYC